MKKGLAALLSLLVLFGVTACTKQEAAPTADISNAKLSIRNKSIWTTPPLFPEGFYFEIQDAGKIVEDLGIGGKATPQNSATGQERMARAEEWGYSFFNLDGVTDGTGRKIKADFKAANREEAVNKIFTYLNEQYKSQSLSGTYYSMNGHYPFHHYAGEAGFDVLGSEIGESINSYQWHIALNRGAARQYGKPWFIDFSMWNHGTMLDYTDGQIWKEGSLNGGHSLNLMERSLLMSYMAGASSLVAEAGAQLALYENNTITPYGETCKKLNTFTKQNNNIGIPYTPFALVLDYYHGTYSGIGKKLSFNQFPYSPGDQMTDDLINTLWKGGISLKSKNTQAGVLVNNTYGDLFDVLLQNASPQVLASYPSLILSGNIVLTNAQANTYSAYVKQGGVLVLNSAYKKYFPLWNSQFKDKKSTYEFSYGSGSVIVYGGDYETKELPQILMELKSRFVPFSFSQPVEHLINVTEDSVLVTLINNQGVSKRAGKETAFSKKELPLTIACALEGVTGVNELYASKSLKVNGTTVSLSLKSGEIAVLEYKFH